MIKLQRLYLASLLISFAGFIYSIPGCCFHKRPCFWTIASILQLVTAVPLAGAMIIVVRGIGINQMGPAFYLICFFVFASLLTGFISIKHCSRLHLRQRDNSLARRLQPPVLGEMP